MKILIAILTIIFASVNTPTANAEFVPSVLQQNKPPQEKVLLLFRYYNTSTWGETTKHIKKKVLDERVLPVLSKNNFEIITDEKYFAALESRGYADLSSVEKDDIFDAYKNDGFNYVIFIEMEPIRKAAGFGFESSANVKIVDMTELKYLFSGKIYQLTKWGGAGTVAEQIGDDIVRTIETKMLKNKR